MLWLDQPCVSCYNCKLSSAVTIRKIWKKNKKFIIFRSWKLRGTPGATQWGHEQKEREWALGSTFYWGWWWAPRVYVAHSLAVNLKCKSGNLKCRKRERQVAQMVSCWNQPRSLRHRSWGRGGHSPALYLVQWLTTCLLTITIFEVDAS